MTGQGLLEALRQLAKPIMFASVGSCVDMRVFVPGIFLVMYSHACVSDRKICQSIFFFINS